MAAALSFASSLYHFKTGLAQGEVHQRFTVQAAIFWNLVFGL